MQPVPLSEAEQKAANRRAQGNSATRVVDVSQVADEKVEVASALPAKEQGDQLPRGIFLLKESATIEGTDGTSHELSAGTQMALLRRDHGKMKVTHNGVDYLLEENQLTRNIKAVGKLIASRKN
jgi:hypothetical protein